MKIYLIVTLILTVSSATVAQKKVLDHSTSMIWPTIGSAAITNDGKFAAYEIAIPSSGVSYIIQSTELLWKKVLSGVGDGNFTPNSRKMIFLNQGDSLGVLELGTENILYISGVGYYNPPQDDSWLFYRSKDSMNVLRIVNLQTGQKLSYTNITESLFNKNGQALIMEEKSTQDSIQKFDVKYLDLITAKLLTICHACEANQFYLDDSGNRLVFFENKVIDGQANRVLRYYDKKLDSAVLLVNPSTPGMTGMSLVEGSVFFNRTGNKIFCKIEKQKDHTTSKALSTISQVDVRGTYDDERKFESAKDDPILTSIDLNDSFVKMMNIQQFAQNGIQVGVDKSCNWIIYEKAVLGDHSDYKWRQSVRPDIYLLSTNDGVRRILKKQILYRDLTFSLSGKYVIWFDRIERQWFAHNILKNSTKNITNRIPVPVFQENDEPDFVIDEGIGGWLANDIAVLIYDRYDIWQVDPDGIKVPINITHGFGAKNKIQFRYINFHNDRSIPIQLNDTLILSAFNRTSKDDGFFNLSVKSLVLKKLIMSPNSYTYNQSDLCGVRFPGPIIKARDKSVYICSRMSANEYPNLYITSSFEHFAPLSDLSPQKVYNWYTSELLHWSLFDGQMAEGILYKPENFNLHKKYPIIFYYYEKNDFALNYFIHPELSDGQMNIPWFVSNGYLVFVPDIYYKIGYPGRSALNSVVSAAIYLAKKPWIDVHRMGLQGHSYGGFETNYIVSHSALFAAAATASGVSNLVSDYASYYLPTWFHETRQGRIGATLWEKPNLYIENSPIFKANNVFSPLLIMHTKDDQAIPYSNAIQWYNALRRLGKKVWLLGYDGEYHVLSKENNQLDYSIRLSQFFDHFLKGKPAPTWMK